MVDQRRYDIDWLRVIAIGLLLIYHVAIGFQPWGVFIQFIQSDKSLEKLWIGMSMINVWRIPFLFFVSGMGVFFALKKRNWKQLIKERTVRILVPFVFGTLVIVPVHVLLWTDYYSQDYQFQFNPSHLWFLGNIFSYIILGLPLLFGLYQQKDLIEKRLSRWLDHPLKLFVLTLPFLAEIALVQPESFETYALNWHGYFIGITAFLTGFIIMISGKPFWETVKQWYPLYFIIAFGLYQIRVWVFDLNASHYLMAFESVCWILGVFGFGYRFLNKPSNLLKYLSQAAYPIYIIHMIWIYLASYYFFQLEMNTWHQLIIVSVITFLGSFISYHYIIRPIKWIRPLFGLKT